MEPFQLLEKQLESNGLGNKEQLPVPITSSTSAQNQNSNFSTKCSFTFKSEQCKKRQVERHQCKHKSRKKATTMVIVQNSNRKKTCRIHFHFANSAIKTNYTFHRCFYVPNYCNRSKDSAKLMLADNNRSSLQTI